MTFKENHPGANATLGKTEWHRDESKCCFEESLNSEYLLVKKYWQKLEP